MTLEELMAGLQPNPEELRRQQRAALFTNLGAGLLSARRGQELQGASAGLLGGMNAAAHVRDDAQQQALRALQLRQAGMQYLTQEQQYNDQTMLRQQENEYQRQRMGGGMPAASAQSPQAFGMNDRSSGQMPTPQALPQVSSSMPPQQAMPGQQPDKRALAQKYQAAAEYWSQQSGPGAAQKAQFYSEAATKAMPQIKEQKTLTQNGQRVVVNLYTDGTHEILPDLGPDKEKAHFTSNGQLADIPRDPFDGSVIGQGVQMQLTPEQTADLPIKQANLKVAQGQLGVAQYNATKPTYDADRGGYVAPPAGKGGPSFTPIPGVQAKDNTPATLKEKIAQNNVTIKLVDEAVAAVDKNPDAFGLKNMMGSSAMARLDPEGVSARAKVANLGSQKYHDRSGANVTAAETPRLAPFIPDVNDPPGVVKTKLRGFQRESRLMNDELQSGKPLASVVQGGGSAPGGWTVKRLD
jgi:hypothetical protein